MTRSLNTAKHLTNRQETTSSFNKVWGIPVYDGGYETTSFPSTGVKTGWSRPSWLSPLTQYAAITGTSGSPVFAAINGEAVLLSLHSYTVTGPNLSYWAGTGLIDQMIQDLAAREDGLGSGYSVGFADLSGFPNV